MRKSKQFLAMGVAFAMSVATVTGLLAPAAEAVVGPVGAGFTVTAGDLSFILKQIKIAERHASTLDATHPCSTLVNAPGDGIPDAEQVPDILTSYGLRTVDGSCNNLKAGDGNFAAADQPFPRLTDPTFKAAEGAAAGFFGPGSPAIPSSSYAQKKGFVFDSQPRTVSNLIDDQTSTNPAAVAAAAFPVRTQGNPGLHPCTTDPDPTALPDPIVGVPAGCVPSHQTLFIPNVTTDVGLSPPYNSLFTFFGQFFDHGVDQTVKSGGTVFVPLKADDPLRLLGPDGKPGTGDEVPASQAFMVLTRAQNQPGPDGILGDNPATPQDESADDVQNANNTDTPWVDQSQTYSSHPSHQVFLREYKVGDTTTPFDANNPASISTGKLLGGLPAGDTYLNSPDGTDGIGTWAAVKKQAAEKLGLLLQDKDVTNIPMLATDPYGKFVPGPLRGLPQYVTDTGLVEGDLTAPVAVPGNVKYFDTPFVTDIAHNADPSPQDTDNNPATPPVAPIPDADHTPSADFAKQQAGTYDDEMLNAHFSCGDGRCNENIALSTIHQIFHSEHDRLVDDIDTTLNLPANSALLAQYKSASVSGYGYGERLFQAARFVTEMEYQHLVFEEFARKVQPAVRPFHVYSPDINPAIEAEFAHAVYRFGHSMLDDTVARTNGNGSDNSTPLLTAFLNPPEYFNGGTAGTLTPKQAAGSIVMGSSDQVGNELDEFVTETLRNNLLGLPLDLPTLNMARAREAGVPPLNDVRRQIFGQTNDGQLAPYTSWSDFGQHLKHPESLINFVAAYGLHTSITSQSTLAGKRAAAKAIVDPAATDTTPIPGDAAEFMFGTGAWASGANGVTITGLDNVDLWVGGLAEITNLFGGMLGSTFNYVFETQLEKLQDGDRLYYLARTPGMNLRTQLESNSFSEIIQRNTDNTNSLKADAFATADCKFQLGNITGPYNGSSTLSQTATPPLPPLTGAGTVNDDPTTTDCDENQLLLKQPNGTIQYRQVNKIDPSGINGQSVYQGSDGNDRVFGGNDNDTFWGGLGNDVIEGNGGDDVALGGDGNDIITDLSGADVLKGGPGNDAIDSGIGNDINMGGDGQDFINAGANDNESFAGPGNDFIIAGQGADAVFGDGGDDWIEGGTGQDLLQGDHGAPFFDDPAETAPGNDIFVGQVGENDYDAEGGDDVMLQNAAIDRNAGAGGFDWATHQGNTIAANDDMMINNNLGGLPIQAIVNRDRWQETEADSGWNFNDTILGTDGVLATPRLITGGGFTGCDALDQAGVDRISGLADLLPPSAQWLGTAAAVSALSASGTCPLTGPVWGEGDILLGGAGSDTITGRAGDEVIDGDKYLQVAITVRTDPANPTTEIGRTDLMENKATGGSFGPGTAGMTLQAAVFAGLVDPGNLVAVREIVTPTAGTDTGSIDTAAFSGPQSSYTITAGTKPGQVIVSNTGPVVAPQKVSDGTDTLTNIERLQFTDATVSLTPPDAPTGVSAVAGNASASVSFTAPVGATSFTVKSVPATAGAAAPTVTVTDGSVPAFVSALTNGVAYQFQVAASNQFGQGAFSALSNSVTPTGPVAPAAASLSAPLVFGNTTIGTTSAAQTVTLTNTGGSTLNITSIAIGGTNSTNFAKGTTTCGATLAPAASCTTNVTFTPSATGTRVGSFVVTDNATGSPHSIALTGSGTAVPDTTAPTLTNRVPAVNATGVAPAADLSVTFSEVVQGVSTANFTVRQGANPVLAATVTTGPGANQFTLNPTANLAASTVYTVTLTGNATTGIRDGANNPLASTSWTFTTGAVPDTTPPTVSALTPVNNATNQAVTVNATATFSEAITGFSTTTATIRVGTAATGAVVPAGVTFNTTTRVLTINPTTNLAADTRYTVRLTNGIKDTAGNALAPVSWTFLTGPAPTLTARTPAPNANGIAVGSNITATFSEGITGFSATTATVRRGTAAPVGALVTYNATTRVLTINPNANLATDTLYTVTLTGSTVAIRDNAGNPLATTTWTFRTGPAPTVITTSRTPASGAVGASRTANITATFSENVKGVTGATVTLRTGTSPTVTPIAAVVSYNASTHVVTINPNATLPANTQFTVRLTGGITDIAGNPLTAATWSFRTGA